MRGFAALEVGVRQYVGQVFPSAATNAFAWSKKFSIWCIIRRA